MHKASNIKFLILAGGKSERMGFDKALLQNGSKPQILYIYEMLRSIISEVYISVRNEQGQVLCKKFPDLEDDMLIVDKYDNAGPLGGVLSAFEHGQSMGCSWFVVACDLFCLDLFTVEFLLKMRDIEKLVTVYRSASKNPKHRGLPEPLCAIYEYGCYRYLKGSFQDRIFCPRKIILNLPQELVNLLDLPNPDVLANINNRSDYQKFLEQKASSTNKLI